MGREIRRVPADWEHPRADFKYRGHDEFALQPMHDESWENMMRQKAAWEAKDLAELRRLGAEYVDEDDLETCTFEDYYGEIDPKYYRPDWPDEIRTHFQLYETCTEGTPLTPPFATLEEVARYAADHGASSFGYQTATYEEWLAFCKKGWAPSAVAVNEQLLSGPSYVAQDS